jgi:hypothetical protein
VRGWVASQKGRPPSEDGGRQAENILIGAIQCIGQCCGTIRGWLDRKPGRRSAMQRVATTYCTKKWNGHLVALIDCAITAVESATWRNDFWVGALPIAKAPRPRSAAQRAHLEQLNRKRREAVLVPEVLRQGVHQAKKNRPLAQGKNGTFRTADADFRETLGLRK